MAEPDELLRYFVPQMAEMWASCWGCGCVCMASWVKMSISQSGWCLDITATHVSLRSASRCFLTSASNSFSHHGAISLRKCTANLCHEWNISATHNFALGYFQNSFKVDGVINSALPQTPVRGHQKMKDWRWTSEISYQQRTPFK